MKYWNNTIGGLLMMLGSGAVFYLDWRRPNSIDFGDLFAAIIFMIVGIFLLVKGVRNKFN